MWAFWLDLIFGISWNFMHVCSAPFTLPSLPCCHPLCCTSPFPTFMDFCLFFLVSHWWVFGWSVGWFLTVVFVIFLREFHCVARGSMLRLQAYTTVLWTVQCLVVRTVDGRGGTVVVPVSFKAQTLLPKNQEEGDYDFSYLIQIQKQMLFFWKLNNLVDNHESKTTRKTKCFPSDSWASTRNSAAFSRFHSFKVIRNQPFRKWSKKRYKIIANKWSKCYNLQKYLIDNRGVEGWEPSKCDNKHRKICREN